MYSWIWKKLPGGRVMKVIEAGILLAAIALFMFIVGFPAIEHLFLVDQPAISQ
jgi:hypothetical protein